MVVVSFSLSVFLNIVDSNRFSGLHCAQTEQDVKAHLDPILNAAVDHLKPLRGAVASTSANTVIYLLATAGMRNLGRKELARYDDVLHHACELIRSYSVHFKFHTTNIRTIPGQQEGLFVWTYLNYGPPMVKAAQGQ